MARRRGLQAGNSAIPGFTWTRPARYTGQLVPGPEPEFPALGSVPPTEPAAPLRPHGLPVAVARKIHDTLIDPTAPDMKELFPRANRGPRPVEEPRQLVYNSDGSVKLDARGNPVYRHIPYLGGNPVTGPYAPEFADPGPAPWAAAAAASQPIQTDEGFIPPPNPRFPRSVIAGNRGLGPERGGVRGQTDVPE